MMTTTMTTEGSQIYACGSKPGVQLSHFGICELLNRCVIVSKRRGFWLQFEPEFGGVEWESGILPDLAAVVRSRRVGRRRRRLYTIRQRGPAAGVLPPRCAISSSRRTADLPFARSPAAFSSARTFA